MNMNIIINVLVLILAILLHVNTSIAACTNCIAGKYCNTNTCTSCPNGQYSAAGDTTGPVGTTCSTTLCGEGAWCANGNKNQCPVGRYSSSTGLSASSQCTPCSAEYTTISVASTSINACSICAKGYYRSNDICAQCPTGQSTTTAGATSIDQCGMITITSYYTNYTNCTITTSCNM